MKRSPTRVDKIKRVRKIAGRKQTGAAFEACEREDFNCLAGAGGLESILSVVEVPKLENGSSKSLISFGVIRFSTFAETRCENLL